MDTIYFYLADAEGDKYAVSGFAPGPVIEENGRRYQQVTFTTPIIGMLKRGMRLKIVNGTLRLEIGVVIVDRVSMQFYGQRFEQVVGRLIERQDTSPNV